MASFANRYDYLLKDESYKKEQERLANTKTGKKINSVVDAVDTAAETVTTVISAPFNFAQWLVDNWQISLIGIIALLVLIKD